MVFEWRSFTLESTLNSSEVGRFIEVLSREAPGARQKLEELGRASSYLQTPFIFGLTAFQSDFRGIQPFVENHLQDLPEVQRTILLLLAMVHKYGHKSVSKDNFADILGLPQSRPVDFQQALSPAALGLLVESERGFWRTSHELIATELIIQILSKGMQDRRNWKSQLTDAAISLANFCNPSRPVQLEDLASIADRVFLFRDDADPLGTVNTGGPQFSSLASDVPSSEARLRLFQHLADTFSNKPHYWAHLGRFYSVELHRFEDALSAIERAIQLDNSDSQLHHMKGMVLRNALISLIGDKTGIEQVVQLGKKASECFEAARERSPDDLYGYISEVQMLIRTLDYLSVITKKSAIHSAAESNELWLREAFLRTEELLAAVRRLRRGERPSEYEERCRADLDQLYGAHDEALQRWQNLLDRKNGAGVSEVFAPPIRRQIVWIYLARVGRQWDRLSTKDIKRSMELLEQNMAEEPGDDRNTRLWLRGSRYLKPSPSLDAVLEKVAYWKSQGDSIDACYYLYVLCTLQALSGSTLAAERAMREIEETRGRARYRRDRSYSSEWLGVGDGLSQLIPQDEMGEWNDEKGFWEHDEKLTRMKGVIVSIAGPQAGEIEFDTGIKAFFVPGSSGVSKARDENTFVTCYLGFSYDGPRAWSVQRIDSEQR
jgi:tetratricopeptide (TPR) repeat protein